MRDAGERAAVQLAVSRNANQMLMDGRKGVNAAQKNGSRLL
jgi:predicted nucleic acid-binding protein